ncbi:hypothetical protein DFJ77DRAFT_37610 [Powellomyces hirtus]|nr:hypothetical protein DFJ77DRAFT_37610 [Powellomyces hirtus]
MPDNSSSNSSNKSNNPGRKGKGKNNFVPFDHKSIPAKSSGLGPAQPPPRRPSIPLVNAPVAGTIQIQHPQTVPVTQEEEGEELCFICADTVTWYAIGECNHRVCHLCSLRLRALYKQKTCALCKTDLHEVVYTKEKKKLFQEFDLPRMAAHDRKLKIFFDSPEIYEDVMILLRFNCPDPGCDVACTEGWRELKDHVRKSHGMYMCELCTRHKKLFTHEHALYTRAMLDRHNRTGDPDDPSFKGHPQCGFCRVNYYGQDELFEHCREKHEQCFLCQRNGVRNQYYKNYLEMEAHFQSDHYPCYDPECLEKKFVVFNSEIDLAGHQLEVHGNQKSKAKGQHLDLTFTYAGSPSRDIETNQSRRAPAPKREKGGRNGRGERENHENVNNAINNSGGAMFRQAGDARPVSQDQALPSVGRQENANVRRLRPPPGFGSALTGSKPVVSEASTDEGPVQSAPAARQPSPGIMQSIPAMPTPSEAAGSALPFNASTSSGSPSPEEAEVFQKVQQVLNHSTTKVTEFKSLAAAFRQSLVSADDFVSGFMSLAMQNKFGKQLKDAENEAGKVWRRMADTVPDPEEESDQPKGKGKGKGKFVPLYSAPRTGGKLKNEMMRAWNDWKVQARDEPAPRPPIPSYANSAATPSSILPVTSAKTPAASAARVLVIKNKASKQRVTRGGVGLTSSRASSAGSNTSVWERVNKNLESGNSTGDEEQQDKRLPVTFKGAPPPEPDSHNPSPPQSPAITAPRLAIWIQLP